MSLQSRLAAFIAAVGADIKALNTAVATIAVANTAWQTTALGAQGAAATGWQMNTLATTFLATGDAGAFTRNADGTLTVRDAGVYTVSATVFLGAVAGARRLAKLIKGTDIAASNVDLATDDRDGSTGGAPAASISFVGYLAAGTVLSLWSYTGESVANRLVQHFGISRVSSGPQGPTGPAGPVGTPPLVSELPGSPTNGQEVYFQDAAMAAEGIAWHLRYISAISGTYKWVYVGGSTFLNPASGNGLASAAQASGVYADFTTPGPSLTIPLAGIWDIEFSAFLSPTAANYYWMTPKFGAAAADDNDSIQMWGDAGNEAHMYSRSIRRIVAAAATVVKLQYKVGAGTCGYSGRVLGIRPVRVG